MSSIDGVRSKDSDATLWQRLRELAEAETGMDLSGSRLSRLRDATEKVLAAEKPAKHLQQILAHPNREEPFLDRLTAELTVGETFFFRNEHHFRALAEDVIPLILHENDTNKEIRVWTAGCSTGEEPYSVAILLDDLVADKEQWHVSILATDLNPEFLEQARLGRYRQWSFRGTDIHQDRTYFVRQGDEYHLVPKIREHVRFNYLNLVKDVFPSPLNGTLGLDLILFRNVAIYLKPAIVDAIVEITETGSSLRANNLRVVDTLLTTTPRLIVNRESWKEPWKRQKVENIALLLGGALVAEGKVGLKLNCPRDNVDQVSAILPSMKNPTISRLSDENWVALETILEERQVKSIIPALKQAGACDLIEYPLNKVID